MSVNVDCRRVINAKAETLLSSLRNFYHLGKHFLSRIRFASPTFPPPPLSFSQLTEIPGKTFPRPLVARANVARSRPISSAET